MCSESAYRGCKLANGTGSKEFNRRSNAGNQGAAEYMPDAQYLLAQCYQNGEGIEKNIEKAKELYERAVAGGVAEAKEILESMLQNKEYDTIRKRTQYGEIEAVVFVKNKLYYNYLYFF